MSLITFADLAKLKNVSRSAVSQRKSAGILDGCVVKHNGKTMLNKELAMEAWDNNTPPLQTFTEKAKSETAKLPDGEIPSFNESKARTEHLKAELLQLEVDEKEKVLVKSAEVELSWIQVITAARTKVLGIPTKAKQRIPDLDTNAMKLLEDIVRETLEDLASENVQTA